MVPAPLLEIPNNHYGFAPSFPPDKHVYTGFFENEYGEQWVFRFDRRTKEGTVTGGDVSWKVYPVVDGEPGGGLLLSDLERGWLLACWVAAHGLTGWAGPAEVRAEEESDAT